MTTQKTIGGESAPDVAFKQGRMRPSSVTTSYNGLDFWKKSGFLADTMTCISK
jgi:hypothetical protein